MAGRPKERREAEEARELRKSSCSAYPWIHSMLNPLTAAFTFLHGV
jgi:hypothetical protein